MNIKKLIIPVGSLIAVIVALIIGVVILNNSDKVSDGNTPHTQGQPPASSPQSYLDEADQAYQKGDMDKTISSLEKAKVIYQDQNNRQAAAEIADRIASIQSLQQHRIQNTNADKTPAPLAEE